MKLLGIIIIIAGIALTSFTAFTFFTKEKVVDLGAVEITREAPHTMSWSPVLGIVLIAIGGVVLWQSSKK